MNETLIDALKAYTAALEQKIVALEQRVAECTTQNTQCTEAHARQEERIAALEGRIAQLEAALAAATAANATVAQEAPKTLSATDTAEEAEPEIEVELITDDEVEEPEEKEEETLPSTPLESAETTSTEDTENTQGENTQSENTREAQLTQSEKPASMYGKSVSDIRKGISIGDRFLFQRELFQSNPELLQKTLTELNELHSFDEAMAYIEAHFDWDKDQPAYELFLNALHRRFAN